MAQTCLREMKEFLWKLKESAIATMCTFSRSKKLEILFSRSSKTESPQKEASHYGSRSPNFSAMVCLTSMNFSENAPTWQAFIESWQGSSSLALAGTNLVSSNVSLTDCSLISCVRGRTAKSVTTSTSDFSNYSSSKALAWRWCWSSVHIILSSLPSI